MAKRLPRVQRIVIPILEDALGDRVQKVGSWVEDVDRREFPLINVRRLGGFRNRDLPKLHALPVIEMTAYGIEDLPSTEQLYEDALDALFDAHKRQTRTPAGYLSSVKETMGATQFSSLYKDSWRIQGLIELGIRPPRK